MIEVEVHRTGVAEWTVRHDDSYEPWTVWGTYGSSTAAIDAAQALVTIGELFVWRSS